MVARPFVLRSVTTMYACGVGYLKCQVTSLTGRDTPVSRREIDERSLRAAARVCPGRRRRPSPPLNFSKALLFTNPVDSNTKSSTTRELDAHALQALASHHPLGFYLVLGERSTQDSALRRSSVTPRHPQQQRAPCAPSGRRSGRHVEKAISSPGQASRTSHQLSTT